jgi:hypothetical protein
MAVGDQDNRGGILTSQNRHSRVWKIAIVVAILVLIGRIALLAADIGSGSRASTILSFIVIVVVAGALILVPLQMIRSFSVAQFNAAVRANPGAIVLPASRAPSTSRALRSVNIHKSLPLFMTWVVTSQGMQIWKGAGHPKLLANIPWSDVQYVAISDNIKPGSGPKLSAALAIQWINYTGEMRFFLRRPSRPMYPAPLTDVQKAYAEIEPFLPSRND